MSRVADIEWLEAHVFNLHYGYSGYPASCQCDFCVDYRLRHGDDVDPWCGPWPTREVVYRP
jgi:hypothetical protein